MFQGKQAYLDMATSKMLFACLLIAAMVVVHGQEFQDCLSGLNLTLYDYMKASEQSNLDYYISNISQYYATQIKDMCSTKDKKDAMTSSFKCVIQMLRSTLDDQIGVTTSSSLSKLLLSNDSAPGVVDILCKTDLTQIQSSCIAQKVGQFTYCVYHFGSIFNSFQDGTSDLEFILDIGCPALDYSMTCLQIVGRDCGCATEKLFTDLIRGPLYPKRLCNGGPEFDEITCNPTDPQEFVQSENVQTGSGGCKNGSSYNGPSVPRILATALASVLFCIAMFKRQV